MKAADAILSRTAVMMASAASRPSGINRNPAVARTPERRVRALASRHDGSRFRDEFVHAAAAASASTP